ncbi:hypothetical protein TrLO_g10514 [Triparma laevis f. longispina]|uniref:Plastid lipid-associated protein/fibrillin conserved domain-containing protein n=1 Tax=Triparma laevis f. longispina TaxID=1714387 RepID=A0A9W7FND6_9STRA|nr:hypothetical protein TrLO_g10514 [Triparma laevis f. longispina]
MSSLLAFLLVLLSLQITTVNTLSIPQLKSQIASILPPRNGVGASAKVCSSILSLSSKLEDLNPTSNPATSNIELSSGSWKVEFSDAPPPSNGQLGPFVGLAIQKISTETQTYSNILSLPPIKVQLDASYTPLDSSRLKVTFETLEFRLLDKQIIKKSLPKGTTRIWCLTYVDSDTRIVRAGAAGGKVKGVESDQEEDAFFFYMSKHSNL